MTPLEILDLPMQDSDAGATTIRGYLVELLRQLWADGEGFGGKRPFGNSGWEYELYEPLARAGLIEAKFDEDGYFETCDNRAGHALIAQAMAAMRAPKQAA